MKREKEFADFQAPKIVIFDIDGTLADTDHRLKHIYPEPGQKKRWDRFFAEAVNDPLISHTATIFRMFQFIEFQIELVLLTGRPEKEREATEAWLNKHDLQWDNLLMRPEKDNRKDFIVKKEVFEKAYPGRTKDVICAFEDRLHVAEMWRELGIPVLLCNDEWRGTRVSNESAEGVK